MGKVEMRPSRVCQDVYLVGDAELSHSHDCCVYLIDAGDLVLIDTGAGRSFDKLAVNISALGFAPEKLSSIILTHAHIDHVGSAREFQERYGAKIIAHSLDVPAVESGRGIGAEYYGVGYEPCRVDLAIASAEHRLRFSRYEICLVHIPGHTPGSLAVYVDMGKRVLFGQDIHGPYHLAGANVADAVLSLRRLIGLKAEILCEGHFGVYRPASEVKRYIESYLRELER